MCFVWHISLSFSVEQNIYIYTYQYVSLWSITNNKYSFCKGTSCLTECENANNNQYINQRINDWCMWLWYTCISVWKEEKDGLKHDFRFHSPFLDLFINPSLSVNQVMYFLSSWTKVLCPFSWSSSYKLIKLDWVSLDSHCFGEVWVLT